MANPGVVWLASSAADIASARHLLRELAPGGLLDELGFLVLQGAISDRLYPAVTTIMTRARYLVFVPAVYRHLEDSGKARGRDADRLSRELQFALRTALLAAGEGGVIGKEAGRDLVRVPSNVYWNALARLGIAREAIFESSYLDRLQAGDGDGSRVVRDDDKAVHLDLEEPFWDPSFPSRRVLNGDGAPEPGLSFRLARAEAEAIRERYARLAPPSGATLLTHLIALRLRRRVAVAETAYPWDVPELPAALVRVVAHARLLSLLAQGATLQYHDMLLAKRGEPRAETATAFRAWHRRARRELAGWRLDEFFALASERGGLRAGDADFLARWRDRVVAAEDALADGAAREAISAREHRLRGSRARLRSAYQLREWRPWGAYPPDASYLLGYRHGVGRVLATDIADGLGAGA